MCLHPHTHVHAPRVKALKDDSEKLQGQLNIAERNAASMDAQRKSAIAEKAKLAKQVGKAC